MDPSGLLAIPNSWFLGAAAAESLGSITLDGVAGYAQQCPIGACVASGSVPANNPASNGNPSNNSSANSSLPPLSVLDMNAVAQAAQQAIAYLSQQMCGDPTGACFAMIPGVAGVMPILDESAAMEVADGAISSDVAADAPATTEETITLYHGSVDNYSGILDSGLDSTRGTTYVTTDIDAAIDTVMNHSSVTLGVTDGSNAGIVTSQVPASSFYQYFDPFSRPYGGWHGSNLNSVEIPMNQPIQFDIFNNNIVH